MKLINKSGSEHKVLKSVFSFKEIRLLDIIGRGIYIAIHIFNMHCTKYTLSVVYNIGEFLQCY